MTVKEIVKDWLETYDYDGLKDRKDDDTEPCCTCELDDLISCGDYNRCIDCSPLKIDSHA